MFGNIHSLFVKLLLKYFVLKLSVYGHVESFILIKL